MKIRFSFTTILLASSIIVIFSSAGILAQSDLDDIVVGKYRTVRSEILDEDRTIYVHLPDNYDKSNDSYPVVYHLYGHFIPLYFLPASRAIDILGENGRAPKMILVGVKNREFRYRDLLPVDYNRIKSGIENFTNFFETELVPFVENNYRTLDYRVLVGPQAGAIFGVYTLAENPDLFNAYILSNPFWIGVSRKTLLDRFSSSVKSNDFSQKFLMITYLETENPVALSALYEFAGLVRQSNFASANFILNSYKENPDYYVTVDIDRSLQKLFADYRFPGKEQGQELKIIQDYYDNLSSRYGFPVKITEFALVYEGDKFMREESHAKAREIFEHMLEQYPESLMALDRLGDVCNKTGKYEEALEYYEKFLELQPINPRVRGIIEEIRKKGSSQ